MNYSFYSIVGLLLNSVIDYWHHDVVCLPVCPRLSVCNAVYCGVQGRCKVVLIAGNVLVTSSEFFAVGLSFSRKTRQNNELQKARNAISGCSPCGLDDSCYLCKARDTASGHILIGRASSMSSGT